MKFTGHKKRLSDFRIAVFDTHPAVETSLADDPFGRSMRRTEPSRAAIFWTAFLDGPMGGLFGPTEFPYAPQRLFDAPETEAVHDLTTAGDQVLKEVFVQLDPATLRRIKSALTAAETAHAGDHEAQTH